MIQGFLTDRARDGLKATVEALFPENDYGAPDYRSTELVTRSLAYFEELPRSKRRLLLALFVLVELGAPFLTLGFRRFSRMTVAEREKAVRGFRGSRFLPVRIIGDALKATTTMIYMSHPLALSYIGMYSGCARPSDGLDIKTVEVRPGGVSSQDGGAGAGA